MLIVLCSDCYRNSHQFCSHIFCVRNFCVLVHIKRAVLLVRKNLRKKFVILRESFRELWYFVVDLVLFM